MKLLGSTASPYVRKARVVLLERELACDFELVDVMGEASPVFAWNPLGKIPCLVRDDGTALYDSSVICEYLDQLGPTPRLLPEAGDARIAVRRWEALADGILDAAILYRWELTQREARYREPAWLDRQRRKIVHGLQAVDRELGDRPFCHGDTLSLADIATVCMLEWLAFRLPEFDWPRAHPALAALAQRFAPRPAFALTRPC